MQSFKQKPPQALLAVGKVLGENQKLAPLLAQARLHEELLAKIRKALPEPLGAHCLYCVLSLRQLILYTDSAVWATRMRFYQAEILEAVKCRIPLKIRVKIPHKEQVFKLTPKLPTPAVLDRLEREIQAIADPELKASFARLIRTLRLRVREGI
jgi:hypothetical protein